MLPTENENVEGGGPEIYLPGVRVLARGTLLETIGSAEILMPTLNFAEAEHHVKAVSYLTALGGAIRKTSYTHFEDQPTILKFRADGVQATNLVRIGCFGFSRYSVEEGSLKLKTIIVAFLSFTTIEKAYDMISKYPAFKEGYQELLLDMSSILSTAKEEHENQDFEVYLDATLAREDEVERVLKNAISMKPPS